MPAPRRPRSFAELRDEAIDWSLRRARDLHDAGEHAWAKAHEERARRFQEASNLSQLNANEDHHDHQADHRDHVRRARRY